jgi:hypothetical protein
MQLLAQEVMTLGNSLHNADLFRMESIRIIRHGLLKVGGEVSH